jgi:pimeloyl-ACP methyl ester carboxylesterase
MAAAAAVALATASGCMTNIWRPSAKVSGEYPAYVFCVRGLVNVFSIGIDELTTRLTNVGVDARTVSYACYPAMVLYIQHLKRNGDTKQIILVGHSHGADDALRSAYLLKGQGIWIDLVVTIDPVDPPRVPSNVRRAFNIYWSMPAVADVPVFRGTQLEPASDSRAEVINFDLRTSRVFFDKKGVDHFNIEDRTEIQNLALEQVFRTIRRRAAPGPHPGRQIHRTPGAAPAVFEITRDKKE